MSKRPATAVDIEQAKRNAAVARARVQTSVAAVKQRLHPKALAADAANTVKSKTSAIGEKASSAAQNRPATVGAAVAVAALVVFRKPIGKALGRLFSRRQRLERREYKERLRVDRERRRAEKEARRAEKEARKQAKQADREASAAPETAPATSPDVQHISAASGRGAA